MIKFERFILAALMLTSLLILGSCGNKSKEISSAVDAMPDNVRFAAVLDAGKLADRTADFIPSDLRAPFESVIAAGKDAIDLSELTVFTLPKGYTVGAVKIADRRKLVDRLKADCKQADGFDDFEVFDCGRRKIAVGESICYIAPDLKTIKGILKEKPQKDSPIAGIRKFLTSSDETVKSAAIASDIYGKKLEGVWFCRAMRFTDSSVTVNLSLLKPDGVSGQIGTLLADEIDPSVAGFIPSGCALVAATGKQLEGAKLFGIESIMRSYIPVELNLSESGTTAWYARPAGALDPDNLLDPRGWNFASLSQSTQAEADDVIESLLEQTGQHARMDPETGCYTVGYGGFMASFGYLRGYTVVGLNGDITYGNSNSYSRDFSGARMAILIDVPKGSRLQQAAQLPCGASLNVKVTTNNFTAKISFYGNTAPALETVDNISPLQNLLPFILGV